MKWIKAGNSPYDNGDFTADDTGHPMDFINAMRFQDAQYAEYQDDSVSFRERYLPEITPDVLPIACDGDLPF